MFLDDCCIPFSLRTTLGSSVLVTCTSLDETVRRDIFLISSDFNPEDNWMEAASAWVFVVKLVGLRDSIFVFGNMCLMTLPADTLKESHASTKM